MRRASTKVMTKVRASSIRAFAIDSLAPAAAVGSTAS